MNNMDVKDCSKGHEKYVGLSIKQYISFCRRYLIHSESNHRFFHHYVTKKTFFKRILFIRDVVCLLNIMPARNFSHSII